MSNNAIANQMQMLRNEATGPPSGNSGGTAGEVTEMVCNWQEKSIGLCWPLTISGALMIDPSASSGAA